MKTRRDFIKGSLLASGALLTGASVEKLIAPAPDIKFSLAEWSFNRSLYAGRMDHLDFPSIAKKEFGITAVEYVNGFFGGKKMEFREAAKNMAYLNELLKRSQDAGVINHLLMVDDEGPLSSTVEKERIESVENHKKWLEAAKILGCLTVRVNLHGEGNPDDRKKHQLILWAAWASLPGP
jgi:sugar phosphate isomerase/epimerase